MPELPEVETVVRTLRPHLISRRIENITWSGFGLRLGRPVPLAQLRASGVGQIVQRVERRAKYVLLFLGPRTGGSSTAVVLVHLGMSGRLRVQPSGEDKVPHTHVVWRLSGGVDLRFIDPRRFGWVGIASDEGALVELRGLGPDPVVGLDRELFSQALATSQAPIKAFLLDQRRVSGLGNIYVCEALFHARIDPRASARRCQLRAVPLVQAVTQVLVKAIANRGTTLRDYVDGEGGQGFNQHVLAVYGKESEPCDVCGTAIRRIVQNARSTFFCPTCQRR